MGLISVRTAEAECPAAETDTPGLPATIADRVDVSLKNIRLQALPGEIEHVFMGPDGRLWHQHHPLYSSADPSLPAIQRMLEYEFGQETPQVRHAEIRLFGPNDLVWFYVRRHNVLLGYDGRSWITRPMRGQQAGLIGQPGKIGEVFGTGMHRNAGGAAWFLALHGIHRWDGTEWSFQQLTDADFSAPTLSVSPGGKFAVASCIRGDVIHLWAHGTWHVQEEPLLDESEQLGYHSSFAVTDMGVLWYMAWPKERPGSVDAPWELRWAEISPQGQLHPTSPENLPDSVPPELAGTRGVRVIRSDASGNIYLAGDVLQVGDGEPEPRVVIVPPDGEMRLLHQERFHEG
jgi:hypothetical protein